jgi:hypothetical protein
MRVCGYIDGMNFYEASKDQAWYPAGWCNWTQTIGSYCPGADVSVRYFTTLYTGPDRTRVRRQKLHLLAMGEEAKADIVYGSLRVRDLRCPACDEMLRCHACGCQNRYSEKMTDVNIAVRLLEDAVDSLFDRAYVVSADVDLVPAVRAALDRAKKSQIFVLLPPGKTNDEEFANLEQEYPGRSRCDYLDLAKMVRFPDDLPRRWNMRLPEHWRTEAGRRPDRPERDPNPPRPSRAASWATESTGYGTEANARGLRDASGPTTTKTKNRGR